MTVRDELERQRRAAAANALGRQEWELEAERAVPTSLIRDIVQDAYHGISQSTSLVPPRQRSEDKPRAPSGGTVPLQPPPGIRELDAVAEGFARADRLAALKVRIEVALLERELEEARRPKVAHDYNPFDRAHLNK